MTATGLLSPSYSPPPASKFQKKLNFRKGYRKIRFKAWTPGGSEAATGTSIVLKKVAVQSELGVVNDPREDESSNTSKCEATSNASESEQCPSPTTILPMNGTRQDPFLTFPIKSTLHVPATFDYFLKIVTPEPGSKNNSENLLDHHLTLLLPFMLESAPLFQSVIALCRASVLVALGQTPMSDRTVVYHRSKALSAVSESIATKECACDETLLTVAMLLTLDYLSGNSAAVTAHAAGLEKLTALRDDLDDTTPWNSFVRRGVDAYKMLGSFVTGKAPIVDPSAHGYIAEAFAELSLDRPLTYPRVPFDSDVCTTLARLPSGFSEMCLSSNISGQMMHILASLTTTTQSCVRGRAEDSGLEAELQTMLSALQRLSLMAITPIEKYLICGLVAWNFQLRDLRRLNLFHDPPLRSFVKLLPMQERPDSIREQKCLMWITMSVAGALNLRTIRMPGTHLVLDRMLTLYPISRKWDTFQPILKSFFWTEQIDAHWKKAWDEGIKRWNFVQTRDNSTRSSSIEAPSPLTVDDYTTDEVTAAAIHEHCRAAPGTMRATFEAARCPFLSKMRQREIDRSCSSESDQG